MLNSKQVKCINHHDAQGLCINQMCKHPSPICSVNNCPSKEHHSQCMYTLQISPFMTKISIKEDSAKNLFDPFENVYEKIIKLINIDEPQYKNKKSKPHSCLSEEEQKLFTLLDEGPVNEITSSLVYKVSNILTAEPKVTQNSELNKQIDAIYKKIQMSLIEIKERWDRKKVMSTYVEQPDLPIGLPRTSMMQIPFQTEEPEPINFTFRPQLCASGFLSSYFMIGQKNKSVQRIESWDKQGYFSLLTPSLEVSNKFKRLEFRIGNIPNNVTLSIGATYALTSMNNKYKYSGDLEGGAYLLGSNGKTYSHCFQNDNKKQTTLKYNNKDTVYMEFDPKNCKIRFYKNPHDKVVISYKKDPQNLLHACVLMWQKKSQVSVS